MKSKKYRRLALTGLLVLGAAAGVAGLLGRRSSGGAAAAAAAPEETAAEAIPVKVIHPKIDPSFKITVTQPCSIDPYYRIDLEARVAGQVKVLNKAIGSPVRDGEVVLTIDVPDLVADLAKKEAIIKQREREREVARAMSEKARADVDIAHSSIRQRESEVEAADAETAFRKQEYERFRDLARRGSITPNIEAERQKFYEAAEAAGRSARAAVDKARADLTGARAKVKEAEADEQLKEELIEVARRDRDVARAQLGYATLRAPFDGVITRRLVNPGSFVQNSATGRGEALVTIERSDVVTIYMNLPDNYAPYVTPGTKAEIEISELPGVTVEGQVSRFAPSLITASNDRTMRVEVDLWNRAPEKYPEFVRRERAAGGAGLKDGVYPLLPTVHRRGALAPEGAQLTPGMYGKMRLVLQRFQNAALIPSGAVFSQGGKPYVFLVRDNAAYLTPVEVQVDDGNLAKVTLVETVNREEVKRDPTADDVLVLTNQGELSDSQPIKPTVTGW
jgi:multidrug resistance efflux pump